MVQDQYEESKDDMSELEDKLKIMLLPKDPNDEKNVIIEIRSGAGGEEAALFAGSLYRMYTMYAAQKGWQMEVMSANETELGGYKEITFTVSGSGCIFKAEIRKRRSQSTACARDRKSGQGTHIYRYCRCPSRG